MIFLSCSALLGQFADSLLPYIEGVSPIQHRYYGLAYSEDDEQAYWVFYELAASEALGGFERSDNFRSDDEVGTGSASLEDYRGSGYDRGHLAPAGDMGFSELAMSESFYLSNMSPQEPSFNRGIWRNLESLFRAWAQEDGEIYIVTGPVLSKGLPKIGGNGVSVPEYYYKIALDWDENEVRSIAFLLPNRKGANELESYQTTIDSIEGLTGIDFFAGLADSVEAIFESQNVGLWNFEVSPDTRTKQESSASQCRGITQKGLRCKRKTKASEGYCWQHKAGSENTKNDKRKKETTASRCTGYTQSGNRCKRKTKNVSGRCWQHE